MKRGFALICCGIVSVISSACSTQKDNAIEATLQCAQLYELKKERYWGRNIGNNKYLFSRDLNTCLALNIHNDSDAGRYFAMVLDMVTDKSLLYLSNEREGELADGDKVTKCPERAMYLSYFVDGTEVKEFGCDRHDLMDKMFERVKAFGFEL